MQKHAARRLHYDLRLEIGGVLQSWAVPKGPSLDPADKRLAVHVEEHPLEYADFEGVIPEGNYGAGAVIVWDRGHYVPQSDPEEGVRAGKLIFELQGYKLRGLWDLFRTSKGKANEWLLVKKRDGFARPGVILPEASILSGLTVEEMSRGADRAGEVRDRLLEEGARPVSADPATIEPMLAGTAEGAFSKPGWLFELKLDGYRLLAGREGDRVRLGYRRGSDATATFPEIAAALGALPYTSFLLDGELVVLDDRGLPSFGRLQNRVHLTRKLDVTRASVELPATLFAFDLVFFDGLDLRPLPLGVRKEILAMILPQAGPVRALEHVLEHGEALFEEVEKLRLEGIMAKKAGSTYRSGRSDDWLKIRSDRTGDFVVAGFTEGKGSRQALGALHLAAHRGGSLVYAGRVGTGFDERLLEDLHRRLLPLRRADPAFTGETPRDGKPTWVEPSVVCEVRYKEWTRDGMLRHPVFLRIRDDMPATECTHPEEPEEIQPPAVEQEPRSSPRTKPTARALSLTNLEKVFWPDEGTTKGDLIDYYRTVSPWLLPYLKDRPVVLTRYPDGIAGKSFFQKDAPGFTPDWVRTERTWSEDAKREIHYFVCDDLDSLLYVANLGTIPLHLWGSRVASLPEPDWCILDLDPKEAPFEHVIAVARAIRALCEEIGIESFVKTSGSTGLHVLLPLHAQCTYEQARSLGQVLARIVARELPEIATVTRSPAARGGRVYIDYVQNGHGRLLVAPFSVRPLPGAPVSTPLRWSEVKPGLDIRTFTIKTVPARMRKRKEDPLRRVLEGKPDLVQVLERLARRLDEHPLKGRRR